MTEQSYLKANIVPYSVDYEETVRGWVECEETYQLVCRGKNYPPPPDFIKSWQRDGIKAYLLFSEGKAVAYGELWERSLELAFEMGHILVAPALRYQGVGSKMLDLLYNRAMTRPQITQVLARLYNENEPMLACLLKSGFEISSTNVYTEGLRLTKRRKT